MFTSFTKYALILLAILLALALLWAFWLRGSLKDASAENISLSGQLTESQSQLSIARTVKDLDSKQSLGLDVKLDFNLTQQVSYVSKQQQLAKVDASVPPFLDTPTPCALRSLWDQEDGLPPGDPCPGDTGGKPAPALSQPGS